MIYDLSDEQRAGIKSAVRVYGKANYRRWLADPDSLALIEGMGILYSGSVDEERYASFVEALVSFIEGSEEREADDPLSPEEDRMALDCIADVWSGYLSEASEALGGALEVFKKVPGEPPAMAQIRHMLLTARGLINKSTTIQRGIVAVMRRELE